MILPRSIRSDLSRFWWWWTKPKMSPAIAELRRKQDRLRASHRSTKRIEKAAFDLTTSRLRKELGV